MLGSTKKICGPGTTLMLAPLVAAQPSGLVRVTAKGPPIGKPAGKLAVAEVALATVTLLAAVPLSVTVAPLTKPWPVIASVAAPAHTAVGCTLVIDGGGLTARVKVSLVEQSTGGGFCTTTG